MVCSKQSSLSRRYNQLSSSNQACGARSVRSTTMSIDAVAVCPLAINCLILGPQSTDSQLTRQISANYSARRTMADSKRGRQDSRGATGQEITRQQIELSAQSTLLKCLTMAAIIGAIAISVSCDRLKAAVSQLWRSSRRQGIFLAPYGVVHFTDT